MKRKRLLQIHLLVLSLVVFGQNTSAQNLELWYEKPAIKWVEALPIGNGRLGAMIFGGVKDDHIQFNEETLWTGYPRDYNKANAYQYLDSIRNLLFAGRQKEAEILAGKEFMGEKSNEGNKKSWVQKVTSILQLKNNPSQPNYNDASWKTMAVPHYEGWETQGYEGMDGAVWFRYKFMLPQKWQGQDLKLDINKIADHDYTYINGIKVGEQNNADSRNYIIPKSAIKAGENSIAILVLNFSGKGGIMGYKDVTNSIGLYPVNASPKEKISISGQWKYFVQDRNVPATGQYQAAYQPFGDVHFSFDVNEADVTAYKRSLDISTALAATEYIYKDVSYKREYIVSAPDQALGFYFAANKKGQISFSAKLSSAHTASSVKRIDENTIALSVQVKDGVLKGDSYLFVKTVGGRVGVKDSKLIISSADEATLYLVAATNFKNYKDITANSVEECITGIKNLRNKNWEQFKKSHIQEYHRLFNTFSINFSGSDAIEYKVPTNVRLEHFSEGKDPAFVALYTQYGRYMLISSSRPGTQPANLQGIWNDLLSPPWGSKYTTNINAEMNYWPAELLNLSPMHQPLFRMIKELSQSGTETAKKYYNMPGWVLHHNTDLWRGTAPINASNHGIWVTGGAWLCSHLWEHYLYTQDRTFLKDTAYPIMKNAALFFNSFLVKDPVTGYLISTPSNSPEHGGLVAGPTMDHQIIRALLKSVVDASLILNIDQDLRNTLSQKYQQIAPNKIGKYGQLQEWMQDVDDTTDKHRHVSHLWGVHPGSEINWEHTPDLMKAARQSLLYRGDEATGWSLGWKINLWARFKNAEHTYHLIELLLSPAKGGAGSYPNLFDAHPPFQIDGNFGGASGVGELLLQSHAGYLDILPALPKALFTGNVKGLCARGGFEVSMQWAQGSLQKLEVLSKAGQPLQLHYNGKVVNISTEKNKVYHFNELLQQQ